MILLQVRVHANTQTVSISYIPAVKMARPGTLVKPAECGGFLRRSAASRTSLCCHAGTNVPNNPDEGKCRSLSIKNSHPFPPVKLLGQVPTRSPWVSWCSLVGRSTTCSSWEGGGGEPNSSSSLSCPWPSLPLQREVCVWWTLVFVKRNLRMNVVCSTQETCLRMLGTM